MVLFFQTVGTKKTSRKKNGGSHPSDSLWNFSFSRSVPLRQVSHLDGQTLLRHEVDLLREVEGQSSRPSSVGEEVARIRWAKRSAKKAVTAEVQQGRPARSAGEVMEGNPGMTPQRPQRDFGG